MLSCWNKAQQSTTCNGRITSNRTSHVHRKPFDLPKIILNVISKDSVSHSVSYQVSTEFKI